MPSSYDNQRVQDLRTLLTERGLSTKGIKKELVDRLAENDASKKKVSKVVTKKAVAPPKTSKPKAAIKKTTKVKKVAEEPEIEDEPEEVEDEEEDNSEEAEVEEEEPSEEKSEPAEDPEEVEESEPEPTPEPSSSSTSEEPEPTPEDSPEPSEEEEPPKPAPKKASKKASPKRSSEPKPKESPKPKPSPKLVEGIFGSRERVSKILYRNRNSLDLFTDHPEGAMETLIDRVFQTTDLDVLDGILTAYVAAKESCAPTGNIGDLYGTWVSKIVNDISAAIQIAPEIIEPSFDSTLGVYRVGDYAVQMDPETESTALVFALVQGDKLVPLTSKTISQVPKQLTLWHQHLKQKAPPGIKEIKKIVDSTSYPSLSMNSPDYQPDDGVSYPVPKTEAKDAVAKDLAEITIPPPSKKTFEAYEKAAKEIDVPKVPTRKVFAAYRQAQSALKTANFMKIAERAGISEDDARYIASHYQQMSKMWS